MRISLMAIVPDTGWGLGMGLAGHSKKSPRRSLLVGFMEGSKGDADNSSLVQAFEDKTAAEAVPGPIGLELESMRAAPLAVAVRRLGTGCVAPALWALLLASGPELRAQRPLPDQEILQYLSQCITWYRDVAAVVQSPADSRQAMFADGLRQSSTETVRLAFEFPRAQAAIPPANTPENVPPEGDRSRNLAQLAAAADERAEQAKLEIEQLNRQLV